MADDQTHQQPAIQSAPRAEPVASSLPRFRTVLLFFESIVALILIVSILIGQPRSGADALVEAGTVLALFLARIALALAQTHFSGAARAWIAAFEFVPAIFLPRFGSIDPCAMPMILSTLRLRLAPTRHRIALFIGVFFVVLRETLLCESWSNYGAIATLLLSIFVIAIPVILSVHLTTAMELRAARLSQFGSKSADTMNSISASLEQALTCLNTADAESIGRTSAPQAIEQLKSAQNILLSFEPALRTSISNAESPSVPSPEMPPQPPAEPTPAEDFAPAPKAPAPKPLPDFPAKLFAIDMRASIFFGAFYLVHAWVITGNPAHNAVLQTIWLLTSLLVTYLAATRRPPGKEDIYYSARILFITLFSIGAFDLINGDLLLFLTSAEVFVVLGTQRGIMPFLLAEVAAFVPRGTDQLLSAIASGKFSTADVGWLYDWNGHATTAAIVALLGVGSYAYARMSESTLNATSDAAGQLNQDEARTLNGQIEQAIALSSTDTTAAINMINSAVELTNRARTDSSA